MMKQPVEQCGGKNLVSQKTAPLGKTRIGGKPDGAVLIASGDQLKEMVRLCRREFGVAHLIDHQHTGGRVAAKLLSHQARIRGGIERLGQVRQRGKQGRIPRGERFDRKRQAQVCFPGARWTQKQDVRGGLHKGEIRQFPVLAMWIIRS